MRSMMKLLVLMLSAVLLACTGHYEHDEFDLVKLKEDSITLFEAVPVDGKISAQWWPLGIVKLKAKNIRKEQHGIYIMLDAFLGEESGLFIPSANGEFTDNSNNDPSYILLGDDIYSYHIKS